MNARTYRWAGMLVVLALLCSGCAISRAQPLQTAAVPMEPAQIAPAVVRAVHQKTLAHLRAAHASPPPADPSWSGSRTTEPGLAGSETYQFISAGWTLTISYPAVGPEVTVYWVTASNPNSGFHWYGRIDSAGHVLSSATVASAR